jgi:hypothetical protein
MLWCSRLACVCPNDAGWCSEMDMVHTNATGVPFELVMVDTTNEPHNNDTSDRVLYLVVGRLLCSTHSLPCRGKYRKWQRGEPDFPCTLSNINSQDTSRTYTQEKFSIDPWTVHALPLALPCPLRLILPPVRPARNFFLIAAGSSYHLPRRDKKESPDQPTRTCLDWLAGLDQPHSPPQETEFSANLWIRRKA